MKLITKDGWVLTDYTAEMLTKQFDGPIEELTEYVASKRIETEDKYAPYSSDDMYALGNTDKVMTDTTFRIGIFVLYPDSELNVATRNDVHPTG